MTTATARFAATETRLNVPEIPATSGAVTSWAATATLTASASGLGHPRPTRRRDHTGAMTTSAAVADTDNANPTSTASSGAAIIKREHARRQRRNRLPPTVRRDRDQGDAAHHRRAQHAGRRLHDDDERDQRQRRQARPRRAGRAARPASRTAPQTIVTLAPDTAVRCVRPATRNSSVVAADRADVSPSTRAGTIAAWSGGSTARAESANRARTPAASALNHAGRRPVSARRPPTARRRSDRFASAGRCGRGTRPGGPRSGRRSRRSARTRRRDPTAVGRRVPSTSRGTSCRAPPSVRGDSVGADDDLRRRPEPTGDADDAPRRGPEAPPRSRTAPPMIPTASTAGHTVGTVG